VYLLVTFSAAFCQTSAEITFLIKNIDQEMKKKHGDTVDRVIHRVFLCLPVSVVQEIR
jgi:hypothetical protein